MNFNWPRILVEKIFSDRIRFTFYNIESTKWWYDKLTCIKCKRGLEWEYTSMTGHRVWCKSCSVWLSQEEMDQCEKLAKLGMVMQKYEL